MFWKILGTTKSKKSLLSFLFFFFGGGGGKGGWGALTILVTMDLFLGPTCSQSPSSSCSSALGSSSSAESSAFNGKSTSLSGAKKINEQRLYTSFGNDPLSRSSTFCCSLTKGHHHRAGHSYPHCNTSVSLSAREFERDRGL